MNLKSLELSEITKKIDPIAAMRTTQWFLLTAEADGQVGTMTAAWGGLGNVWNKKTATVYVRPQRATKKQLDAAGRFTMTFFDGRLEEMTFLGRNSAADVPDKIEKSGLHLAKVDGLPTFEEGKIILVCKTLYKQAFDPECFVEKGLVDACYSAGDFSEMYIAEIEAAYEAE